MKYRAYTSTYVVSHRFHLQVVIGMTGARPFGLDHIETDSEGAKRCTYRLAKRVGKRGSRPTGRHGRSSVFAGIYKETGHLHHAPKDTGFVKD